MTRYASPRASKRDSQSRVVWPARRTWAGPNLTINATSSFCRMSDPLPPSTSSSAPWASILMRVTTGLDAMNASNVTQPRQPARDACQPDATPKKTHEITCRSPQQLAGGPTDWTRRFDGCQRCRKNRSARPSSPEGAWLVRTVRKQRCGPPPASLWRPQGCERRMFAPTSMNTSPGPKSRGINR